jgi:hypothetical protein
MAPSELPAATLEPGPGVDGQACADAAWLAGWLADARPGAVAVALTAMGPAAAASILRRLPADLRDDVARRIGLAAFGRGGDGRSHRGPLFALEVFVDAFGLGAGSALFASVHAGARGRRPVSVP